MRRLPPRVRAWTVLLLMAVAAVFGIQFVDNDGDGTPDVIIVPIPQAPAAAAPAGDLEAPIEEGHGDTLRDERPAEIPAETLDHGSEQTDELGEQLEPRPVGGAQNYSCRQDFSGQVWSSYTIKPTEGVFHYTVSANRPGWSDVLGIVDYFKRTRVASADRVIDFEGNCVQMTPITTGKAWTQGAANNAACFAYEIIATGRETRADWLASDLIKNGVLAAVTRDDAARCGIPLRRVDPSGCVFPPGITDHNALECGNDHTDVAPNFPWDVVLRQLTAAEQRAPTARARRLCQELNRLRRSRLTSTELPRARAIRKVLDPKYVCRFGPPGRVTRR